jgi:PPOX class probable F420-dependent enzyme
LWQKAHQRFEVAFGSEQASERRRALGLIACSGFAKAFHDAEKRGDRRRQMGLDAFAGQRYLSLETYRRSGAGVRTPVWFATALDGPNELKETGAPRLYVYTTADSGKAKRIRRTGVVKIAPCDARGKVTGAWVPAHTALVGGAAFERGMRLLNRKYRPWKQVLDLAVRLFPRHQRVMIAIELA